MIFGSQRDFRLLVGINRELVSDVVEQEILYYKISLEQTQANIYGEAPEKVYWNPVKLNCLIDRGDQQTTSDDFGADSIRDVKFAFIRQDLKDVNTFPEVGDIIQWQEDYYEVDNTTENQLLLGKDENYALTTYGPDYGGTLSIICICHLTRADKVGIASRYEATVTDPASIAAASLIKGGGTYIPPAGTIIGTTAGSSTTAPVVGIPKGYIIDGVQYTPVKVSTLSWEPYHRLPIYMRQLFTNQIKFYWEDIYWKFMNLTFYKKASDAFVGGIALYNIVEIDGIPTLNPYGPPSDGNYIVNLDNLNMYPNRSLGVSSVANPAVMTVTNDFIQFLNRFNIGNGTMSNGAPAIYTVTTAGSANGGLYTTKPLYTNVYYFSGNLSSYNFSSLFASSNHDIKAQVISTITTPSSNNQSGVFQGFSIYTNGPIQVGTKVSQDEYGINLYNLDGYSSQMVFLNIIETTTEPTLSMFTDFDHHWGGINKPLIQLVRAINGTITEVTAFNDII
jgi:hypothetical protein